MYIESRSIERLDPPNSLSVNRGCDTIDEGSSLMSHFLVEFPDSDALGQCTL